MTDDRGDGLRNRGDVDAASAAGTQAGADGPSSGEAASTGAPDASAETQEQPFDEVTEAMAAAVESESAAAAPSSRSPMPAGGETPLFEIPELMGINGRASTGMQGIDLLRDVELNVKIELGRSRMLVEDVLRLGEGSVVELDKLAGDPVDVFVNNRLVARGEVLVLNDSFCVRINDIISTDVEEEQLV